jgi:hypothetical protein
MCDVQPPGNAIIADVWRKFHDSENIFREAKNQRAGAQPALPFSLLTALPSVLAQYFA